MNSSVGKPLLGLMAAACIAVPATIPHAAAAAPMVQSATEAELFDPAPPILRVVPEPAGGASFSPAAVEEGLKAAEAIDPDLLLKLLTFPYHNVYAIGTSVGAALNSALVAALMPLTAGYYFLTNQIDKIEPYIQTTFTNLRNAVPNIFTTTQNEIDYDINLFKQVFGPEEEAAEKEALPTAVDAEADDPGLWLKLLTFPYHNVYAIGTSVGAALNSALVTALIPLTAGYYFLTNQIDKIEPYIQTTLTGLRNAVPNIFTTIKNEIDYDINLFQQIFAPAPDPEMADLLDAARSAPERSTAEATLDETQVTSEQITDDEAVVEAPVVQDGAATEIPPVTDDAAEAIPDIEDVEAPDPDSAQPAADAGETEPAGADGEETAGDESDHVRATKLSSDADTYGRHAKKVDPSDSPAGASAED